MTLTKQGNFAFNHVDQQDDIYKVKSATEIKQLFDSQANELKTTLNNLIDALKATTAAGDIGAAAIQDLTGVTVQALIKSLRDILKSVANGSSGADFINSAPIAGVTGSTLYAQLSSLKSLIDAIYTKTQLDAGQLDTRYYTETELNNGQLDTRYFTETELSNGALDTRYFTETELNNGAIDGRYFTETELGSVTSGSSGAKKIGATPIATSPSDVQGILEWLKNQMDSTVLGQIPDGSVTLQKMGFDPATQAELDTHSGDYTKHPGTATTTNVSNAYSITLTPAPTSYTDKMGVVITINADSTAAATLNVNGLGAKSLVKANGTAITNLKMNGVYTFRYNSTTGNFIVQGEGGAGNAVASDLLSGKTASTDAGDITGTLTLTGSAGNGDVLATKTYYNTDAKTQQTGTMPNKVGSATIITPSSADQPIPQGYYGGVAGDGKVAAVVVPAANVLTGTTIAGTAGTMLNRGAMTITPGTTDQIIPVGYHNGSGIVPGDADLIPPNIANGINLFGVVGSLVVNKKEANGTATTYTNGSGYQEFTTGALSFNPQTAIIKTAAVYGGKTVRFVYDLNSYANGTPENYTGLADDGTTGPTLTFVSNTGKFQAFFTGMGASSFTVSWWVFQ